MSNASSRLSTSGPSQSDFASTLEEEPPVEARRQRVGCLHPGLDLADRFNEDRTHGPNAPFPHDQSPNVPEISLYAGAGSAGGGATVSRYWPGGCPTNRLNARLRAAPEAYPTRSATASRGASSSRSSRAASRMRHIRT